MEESTQKATSTELRTLSVDQRKVLATAIVEGLINPAAIAFERLATEGGDYDQNGPGDYTQTGGGNHNQNSGGGYNQSKAEFGRNFVDLASMLDVIQVFERH